MRCWVKFLSPFFQIFTRFFLPRPTGKTEFRFFPFFQDPWFLLLNLSLPVFSMDFLILLCDRDMRMKPFLNTLLPPYDVLMCRLSPVTPYHPFPMPKRGFFSFVQQRAPLPTLYHSANSFRSFPFFSFLPFFMCRGRDWCYVGSMSRISVPPLPPHLSFPTPPPFFCQERLCVMTAYLSPSPPSLPIKTAPVKTYRGATLPFWMRFLPFQK